MLEQGEPFVSKWCPRSITRLSFSSLKLRPWAEQKRCSTPQGTRLSEAEVCLPDKVHRIVAFVLIGRGD